ncbi:MAG: DnaB-like helicase C-terminal domain-containing protein [Gemmatimonadaceae bacterium]
MKPNLAIIPPDDPRDEHLADREAEAEREQAAQIAEAQQAVTLPASAFLDWPWPALASVVGGMGPGTLGFLCAASGAGKTSFLMSAARRWHVAGRRVYYAGLESRPCILRTQWACRSLGLDAGDVLSGDAERRIRDWPDVRRRLLAQLEMQEADNIRFAPFRSVNLTALDAMFRAASDFDADALVIDHVDHLDGERGNLYESSVAAVRRLLTLAQDTGIRVIAASQTNLTNAGSDRLRFHRPVQRDVVKMGGHKIEVADWMLGLYRPLKANLTREARADFLDGKSDLPTILEHGVTELNVMKHRLYGAREGERIRLGFAKGEVLDAPPPDAGGGPSQWWNK